MTDFQRLFAYEAWANRETLASMRAPAGGPPDKARKILAHLVGTGRLWLSRIHRTEKAVVWPDLSVDESASGLEDLAARWSALLRGSGPDELSRLASYTNSKGEPWTSVVADILMHVVIHSAYHRGQIATVLREAGHDPAYTDFIEAVRRGNLDPP
ncbi:MAG: DinB family protein [Acidobacteriota bacterium]|nr:DinB family protein [Acidobacteriota bacterium]